MTERVCKYIPHSPVACGLFETKEKENECIQKECGSLTEAVQHSEKEEGQLSNIAHPHSLPHVTLSPFSPLIGLPSPSGSEPD